MDATNIDKIIKVGAIFKGGQANEHKKKKPTISDELFHKRAASYFHYQSPGNYHRPWEISLLCSEWEQVGHSR